MNSTIPRCAIPSWLTVLIALLLMAALAACGGGEDSTPRPTRDSAQPEATETGATNAPASGQIARPQATEELEEEAEAEPTRRGLFPRPGSQPGDTAAPEATDTPAVATAPPVLGPTSAETDREVLVAFYNATGGPNWTNNENWLTNEPLGKWFGVTTDNSDRVVSLRLSGNLLSREIPTQLSGEIPPELGNLVNLRHLWLNGNQLSGEIPPELGSLINLRHLQLSDNELSGEIPPELDNLANLGRLSLVGNQLSGCVPSSLQGQLDMDLSDLGGLPFC